MSTDMAENQRKDMKFLKNLRLQNEKFRKAEP